MFPTEPLNGAENGGGGNRTRERFRADRLHSKELWDSLPIAWRIEVSRRQLSSPNYSIPRDARLTQVYAIQEDGGAIKIGRANDVAKRLNGMRTGNWRTLTVLAEATLPARIEKIVHYELARHRIGRSEWFEPHPEVYEAVEALRAYGRGDAPHLPEAA